MSDGSSISEATDRVKSLTGVARELYEDATREQHQQLVSLKDALRRGEEPPAANSLLGRFSSEDLNHYFGNVLVPLEKAIRESRYKSVIDKERGLVNYQNSAKALLNEMTAHPERVKTEEERKVADRIIAVLGKIEDNTEALRVAIKEAQPVLGIRAEHAKSGKQTR
jgi:hypothetical protein